MFYRYNILLSSPAQIPVLIDTTGRKASVIIGAIIYTVGGALQTGSVHIW